MDFITDITAADTTTPKITKDIYIKLPWTSHDSEILELSREIMWHFTLVSNYFRA